MEQQTGGSNGGIINNALKANPTEPVYNEDGSFNEYAESVRNPVAMAKQMYDKSRGDRFIGSADAKPLDYLQFQRIGYFNVDKDSTPEHLIFNRTVSLKDTWSKINNT